jgi:choline-sulfatase
MCVPSRMSFLTGRYCHEIDAWDNGCALDGGSPTWGDFLGHAGYETVLCGRTHFNGPNRLQGFQWRLCDDLDAWYSQGFPPPGRTPGWRRGSNSHVTECGPGDHVHQDYDAEIADRCIGFLTDKAARQGDRPWLLCCGFMHPHFPLIAPPEYFALYENAQMQPLPGAAEPLDAQHPAIRHLRWSFHNDQPLEQAVQRRATAAYWALVTLMDHQIGRILDYLDASPLAEDTVVVYFSDHGEMAGAHGIWQKQCFYEPAERVPLIIRVPGDGQPVRIEELVSLIDMTPTLLRLAGVEPPADLPGNSLLPAADGPRAAGERSVFSEYHAQGMRHAGFMIHRGDCKYCYYVGQEPQLFDLSQDPQECTDLAGNPAYADVLRDLRDELLAIVDPEQIDRLAKQHQQSRA